MMEQKESSQQISVLWRGKKFVLDMSSDASLKELGHELLRLTDVQADTMRLIVPQTSNKSSRLLYPFSDEHSSLGLREASFLEGKFIRMMGAPKGEVDEVLQNAEANLRIAGFEEEEKRMRLRMANGARNSLKLPQGPYIFCEFRALNLPGIELNPPPSEALRRMHMLAADPGVVAVMNKHRWRVGIMTEMAPVGYVGVSPRCILGLNKNKGEEISLRLRTDDLKGFRKYESIKKTLMHELAHMVFSEHDAKFYALDKQLNQEAESLDWTRSKGHTLSGVGPSQYFDEDFQVENGGGFSHKLGGAKPHPLGNARAISVAAAYSRLANPSADPPGVSKVQQDTTSEDSEITVDQQLNRVDISGKKELDIEEINRTQRVGDYEPDPDDSSNLVKCEPDPDDTDGDDAMESEPYPDSIDDMNVPKPVSHEETTEKLGETKSDDVGAFPSDQEVHSKIADERNSSDSAVSTMKSVGSGDADRYYHNDTIATEALGSKSQLDEDEQKLDPNNQELQMIQDSVTIICTRLQEAIKTLQSEVNSSEISVVLQTLFKIIGNVIEHPNEVKFKRIRKANPTIQRNVVNYKAAMEILSLVGFYEDSVSDGIGRAETYLVLKRNDPGLLWLAKSSLEACIAY